MRLEEALLGQSLGQIHIPRGCKEKSEDLRTVARDNARELLRGLFVRRGHGYRVEYGAGCHHLSRRPHWSQVYRDRRISDPRSTPVKWMRSGNAAPTRL